MFASKKITLLLALSLLLSPSVAQSSHAYALPKNTTLGVAIAATAIGAAGAVWYACQPQDPEELEYNLFEAAEYLSLRYEVEIAYFNRHHAALYCSLERTNQLAADIKKLQTLIARAEPYLPENTLDFYRSFIPPLVCIYQKMIAHPRYQQDLHDQYIWERWCNREINWPAAQKTVVSSQSEQQEKPANKTETAKPDSIVEKRSTSFPNWELTHPVADL